MNRGEGEGTHAPRTGALPCPASALGSHRLPVSRQAGVAPAPQSQQHERRVRMGLGRGRGRLVSSWRRQQPTDCCRWMCTKRGTGAALLVVSLALCAAAHCAPIRVSVSSAGVQGDQDSVFSAISGDGRYMVFM